MPRKKIDSLVDFAKGYGAKGLAYIAIHEDGTVKSSFAKFMTEEEMQSLIKAMDGEMVIYFSLQQIRIRLYGMFLVHSELNLQTSLDFLTRMNSDSYG